MEVKQLQTITAEYLTKKLPQDCIDKISKAYITQMNIPWLRMVGRMFDEMSEFENHILQEPTELINNFMEHFPQFVKEAKQKKIGIQSFGKYNGAVYYFKRNDIYYVIETLSNNDVHINNELITFFRNKGLDPAIAICFD